MPEKADVRERAIEQYFTAARPLLDQQKFADAIVILKEGAGRLAGSAQLELALGWHVTGCGDLTDSRGRVLRTIEIAPETEQPYAFLERYWIRFRPGCRRWRAGSPSTNWRHPASATGHLLHAKALDAQAIEPETALRLLEKSIAIQPGDESAHFEMGTVLDRLQRFTDAAAEFERAVALAPSDAAAHYRLARDYDRIGKHEAAQAEREKHAQLVKAQETIR